MQKAKYLKDSMMLNWKFQKTFHDVCMCVCFLEPYNDVGHQSSGTNYIPNTK